MKRGFTLIELIVVIAIIGILSGIVIAFIVGARNRGHDITIRSNLREIGHLAEIYFQENSAYATAACGPTQCFLKLPAGIGCLRTTAGFGSFFKDPEVEAYLRSADIASGGTAAPNSSFTRCKINVGSTASWAAAVKLRSDNTSWWCVDSSGANKTLLNGLINPIEDSGGRAICAEQ